jgi:hypothetical protein
MVPPPHDFSILEPFDGSSVIIDHAVAFCIVVRISCHGEGLATEFSNLYAMAAFPVTVVAFRGSFNSVALLRVSDGIVPRHTGVHS